MVNTKASYKSSYYKRLYKEHPDYYKISILGFRKIVHKLSGDEYLVYNYLIDNIHLDTNTTIGDYKNIIQNTHLKRNIVFSALEKLAYLGYIKYYEDTIYINPSLIYKGSKHKKKLLQYKYNLI